jgi:hypothetical protein
MFGRQICTITDGKTDAAVEMIQGQSWTEKRIHMRFLSHSGVIIEQDQMTYTLHTTL